jgi:hypothetical protein
VLAVHIGTRGLRVQLYRIGAMGLRVPAVACLGAAVAWLGAVKYACSAQRKLPHGMWNCAAGLLERLEVSGLRWAARTEVQLYRLGR